MTKHTDDIAPSNEALNKAASWLGVSDPQKLLDEDPGASSFQARPEGLGLGAKFLPHHKAVHLTAPLEKRFQKRLARNVPGAEEEEGSTVPAKKLRKTSQQPGESHGIQDSSSSDEEEEGRANAFGPAKMTQQQPQVSLKHQLVVPGKKTKQQQEQEKQQQRQQHHQKPKHAMQQQQQQSKHAKQQQQGQQAAEGS